MWIRNVDPQEDYDDISALPPPPPTPPKPRGKREYNFHLVGYKADERTRRFTLSNPALSEDQIIIET